MAAPQTASVITNAEQTGTVLILRTHDIKKAESAAIAALSEMQLLPLRLEVLEPTLESLFMEAVK
jgi:ABC-2 type transport system ATP-binding protein